MRFLGQIIRLCLISACFISCGTNQPTFNQIKPAHRKIPLSITASSSLSISVVAPNGKIYRPPTTSWFRKQIRFAYVKSNMLHWDNWFTAQVNINSSSRMARQLYALNTKSTAMSWQWSFGSVLVTNWSFMNLFESCQAQNKSISAKWNPVKKKDGLMWI